ncbi:MAG: indole-3-glycerol phosphate synthase TrpC [Candidatus Latescibacterota bacterium]
MTAILKEIVEYKREFVKKCKRAIPLRELEQLAPESGNTRSFTGAIAAHRCALIAEIKTGSPSKGIIRDDVNSEDVARLYETCGAACISVLTDEAFFGGSLDRLRQVRRTVNIPIIRKDFIIDPYQIYEARCAGADAVLLIAACLGDKVLDDLIEVAALLNLDCLLEVHDEAEMNRAASMNAPLIGINNRDLRTFKTDLSNTGRLARFASPNALLVSESGIVTADDVRTVFSAGARAVLVGEAIMRERDMAAKVRELAGVVEE